MATQTLLPTFVAQALAERGFLDQIAAGLSSAKYQLEVYVGQGNTTTSSSASCCSWC